MCNVNAHSLVKTSFKYSNLGNWPSEEMQMHETKCETETELKAALDVDDNFSHLLHYDIIIKSSFIITMAKIR